MSYCTLVPPAQAGRRCADATSSSGNANPAADHTIPLDELWPPAPTVAQAPIQWNSTPEFPLDEDIFAVAAAAAEDGQSMPPGYVARRLTNLAQSVTTSGTAAGNTSTAVPEHTSRATDRSEAMGQETTGRYDTASLNGVHPFAVMHPLVFRPDGSVRLRIVTLYAAVLLGAITMAARMDSSHRLAASPAPKTPIRVLHANYVAPIVRAHR